MMIKLPLCTHYSALPALAGAVARLHDKLGGEDVGKLGAVAVAASSGLLLVVVE